jgi:arylsulfatase A-like enzyme
MRDEARNPTRRDFLKVGATIAGAAVLQPWTLGLVRRAEEAPAPSPAVISAATTMELDELPSSLPRSKATRPNIALIVMDTVRVDHLSCYGYRRETTPHLDAFAADARLYTNALSPASWTLPSHASLFTGLSCSAHGLGWLHLCLDACFRTLAEQLAADGYQTVGLSSNAIITPETGLARGFQTFWDLSGSPFQPYAPRMHAQLARWFKDRYDPNRPFFLFMNYVEAHEPYAPPREALRFASLGAWDRWRSADQTQRMNDYVLAGGELSSRDIADLESLYDDEIGYIDEEIGEVLTFFKSQGLDENTLVVITADHGEHFGEHHVMSHQYSIYQPLVHVPLLVRHPARFSPGSEERMVQSHDIYPTVLELAGLGWKPLPGQTCQSLLRPASGARFGITEYLEPSVIGLGQACLEHPHAACEPFNRVLRAIQRDNLKLIRSSAFRSGLEQTLQLYNLANDPMETRNLAAEKPEAARELTVALDAWMHSFEPYVPSHALPAAHPKSALSAKPAQTSPSVQMKAMRGLGYVH